MSIKCDVLIIGAGILGCFAARALKRFDLDVAVVEKREDVCTGITRANTGIIYQGYDQHPGSLKAELCRRASIGFEQLCSDLDVHFRKTGLLMLSFGPNADQILKKKIRNGAINQIDDLKLLDAEQVYSLEPALCSGISHALYSERTYTVNPWELGIAAFENAVSNGVHFCFNEEIINISRDGEGFIAESGNNTYKTRRLLCCAGFNADRLWEMLSAPKIRLVPLGADYLVFDKKAGNMIGHVISVEPEEKGEGLTLVPTADGNILAGPTRRDICAGSFSATSADGIAELMKKCSHLIPDLPLDMIIRSFAAARPNPYYVEPDGTVSGKSINDFAILEDNGFYDLIGVKTPGITCADELGKYIAEKIVSSFDNMPALNNAFDPVRNGITRVSGIIENNPESLASLPDEFRDIVCRCENISKGEILEAIKRGAVTVDGIKRRTGAGMGRCQGGYCMEKIMHIISETLNKDIYEITKDGAGTEIITACHSERSEESYGRIL